MRFRLPFGQDPDDADRLDAWLNNAHFSDAEPAHDDALAAAAVRFHRAAVHAERNDPAARGPAAGSWESVVSRAQGRTRAHDRHRISAGIDRPQRDTTPFTERKSIMQSRLLTHAATFLLVAIVAGASWFTFLGEPSFHQQRAAQTPVEAPMSTPSGTAVATDNGCPVPSLTVDEVVAIVENPTGETFDAEYATAVPEEYRLPGWDTGLSEPTFRDQNLRSSRANAMPATDAEAAAASGVLTQYLTCRQYGTVGQIWALTDPVIVQQEVLRRFPVYRDRAEIRAYIEERMQERYSPSGNQYVWSDGRTISANADAHYAIVGPGAPTLYSGGAKTMWMGERHTDASGSLIVATDWSGAAVEGDAGDTNTNSWILVYWDTTDRWYVMSAGGA